MPTDLPMCRDAVPTRDLQLRAAQTPTHPGLGPINHLPQYKRGGRPVTLSLNMMTKVSDHAPKPSACRPAMQIPDTPDFACPNRSVGRALIANRIARFVVE